MKYTLEPVPAWSLCYCVNGDATGLSDEEIAQIDGGMTRNGISDVCPPSDEDNDGCEQGFFNPYPPFGLACDCLYCYCAIR